MDTQKNKQLKPFKVLSISATLQEVMLLKLKVTKKTTGSGENVKTIYPFIEIDGMDQRPVGNGRVAKQVNWMNNYIKEFKPDLVGTSKVVLNFRSNGHLVMLPALHDMGFEVFKLKVIEDLCETNSDYIYDNFPKFAQRYAYTWTPSDDRSDNEEAGIQGKVEKNPYVKQNPRTTLNNGLNFINHLIDGREDEEYFCYLSAVREAEPVVA